MSKKSNAKYVQQTGGKLSNIKQWNITVSDQGTGSNNITLPTPEPDQIVITNKGASNDLYVVFDAEGSTINTASRATYNTIIEPYEQAEFSGAGTSIGFKCGTGLTTSIKVRSW